MSLTPERLAEVAAGLALDKKAIDVVALDLRGVAATRTGSSWPRAAPTARPRPSTTASTRA